MVYRAYEPDFDRFQYLRRPTGIVPQRQPSKGNIMTDHDDEAVTLKIEQRADRFALVRDHKGQKTELMLTESDILALARTIPSYARALAAPRHRPEAGALAALVQRFWPRETRP
jgi:hypothetical protein